jgi:hypothetical protein
MHMVGERSRKQTALAASMRATSIRRLRHVWGARPPVPPPLSQLSRDRQVLDSERLLARVMGMFAVTAVVLEADQSFEEALEETRRWAGRHHCLLSFSAVEQRIWDGDVQVARAHRSTILDAIEALYALCWALGLVAAMPLRSPVPDSLGALFPDMLADESPNALRSRIAPRSIESIAQELDLYLCAHWLIRQSALAGGERPFKRPHIIIQRRLALEWCCSELAWDEVELDT